VQRLSEQTGKEVSRVQLQALFHELYDEQQSVA
jgi:hypothetical protein